jgi:hypothetical protein
LGVFRRGRVTQIFINSSWCCVTIDIGGGRSVFPLLWSYMAQPDTEDNPKSILLQDRYLALTRDAYLNNKTLEVEFPEDTSNMVNSVRIMNS